MLHTPDGEPAVTSWTALTLDDVVTRLGLPTVEDRPVVIAVDGRSGGGKTTFAERLERHLDGGVLLHTDDVAWWESFFTWDQLMAQGILIPARAGHEVSFLPPAWEQRRRQGTIDVPLGTRFVIVEGVGASRLSLTPYLDAAVWVQSDFEEANRRGIERDILTGRPDRAEAEAFWAQWLAEEIPFLADDRPWERAAAIVCGTPALAGVAYDAETEVLLAD